MKIPGTSQQSISESPEKKTLDKRLIYAGGGVLFLILVIVLFGLLSSSMGDKTDNQPLVPVVPTTTATPSPTPVPQVTPEVTSAPTIAPSHTPVPTSTPKKIAEKSHDSYEILTLLENAQNNEQRGSFAMAVALYKQVLELDRSHPVALKGLQRCQRKQGKASSTRKNKRARRKIGSRGSSSEDTKPAKDVKTKPATVDNDEAAINQASRISVLSIKCKPSTPERGKPLVVTMIFNKGQDAELDKLWLYYRKKDDFGYSQIFAQKTGTSFKVVIPGTDISGDKIPYFLNGIDTESREFFFGSPQHPKELP